MSDRRDPTRSAGLRSQGRGLVARKLFNLNRALRQAVVEQDAGGLREKTFPNNIVLWIENNQTKLARNDDERHVIGQHLTNPPNWLWTLMERAVGLGVEQAGKE